MVRLPIIGETNGKLGYEIGMEAKSICLGIYIELTSVLS